MDENASYVGAVIEDEEAIDAYELIISNLLQKESPDDFIDVITTALVFSPNLVDLDNILYIIDDRHSRHPKLLGVSGRDILQTGIKLFSHFDQYPDALIAYYRQRYGFDEYSDGDSVWKSDSDSEDGISGNDVEIPASKLYQDSFELLSVLWEINHAYYASYELRNFVSELHKMKFYFNQSKPKQQTKTN